ncbi:MAG TPA: VCBS repeat-containing protein, partial [Gemmataceae bacterium]|nr:VCBS repeat-containing protein [Gemmataceae bacterium]
MAFRRCLPKQLYPPLLLLTLSLALFVACTGSPDPSTSPNSAAPATGLFSDVTAESGIQFTYRNGEEADHFAILETVGGGVALLDYDGDGLLDVVVTAGGYFEGKAIRGYGCKLFKNLGNFHFREVTKEAGLDQPQFYTHGCAVADYDRDGWPDLLVTGWGRLALYHNEADGKGGRHFVDVTKAAGLTDDLWSTSAAWGDLDGDGFPDLYVCHYVNWSFANHPRCIGLDLVARDVCPPANFSALPHKLYRNNGNGTFTDVSAQAGLHVNDADKNFGKGMGVIVADLNGDGWPDIYVANDTSGNFLYLNRTRPAHQGGAIKLEDVAVPSGAGRDEAGTPNGSMGLAIADYNGSGRPSL